MEVRGRGQGASYRLGRQFSGWREVDGIVDGTLGRDEVRNLIVQSIRRRGAITNAVVRAMTGYSRNEAVRFMRAMRDDGLIQVRGRGRGAHYVLPE